MAEAKLDFDAGKAILKRVVPEFSSSTPTVDLLHSRVVGSSATVKTPIQ